MIETAKKNIVIGLQYLQSIQEKDGSFLSFSSASQHNFRGSLACHAIFSTALILQNLTSLKDTLSTSSITKRAADFLLKNKSSHWTWNYWARGAKEREIMPYPDDLDDTCVALAALTEHDQSLITGDVLAHSIEALTSVEVKEGGPYRTWLVNNKNQNPVWRDTDLAVNANIAYFLKLQNVHLPNLEQFFASHLSHTKIKSPYYPTPYPILYFLARVVRDDDQQKLRKLLLLTKPLYALDQALTYLALVETGYTGDRLTALAQKVRFEQKADGSWEASVFYTGVNPRKDKKYYAGSAALTTSFCLRVIGQTLHMSKPQEISKRETVDISRVHKKIVSRVADRLSELGPSLKQEGQVYLQETLRKDRDKQIVLLPYMMRISLGATKKNLPDNLIEQLGAASLYGWIAYTIYDDFLDGEAIVSTLPLANVCLRELTVIFTTVLAERTGFTSTFMHIMDLQEEANTWEVTHCRIAPGTRWLDLAIPDYSDYHALADRSLGHTLGSLALCLQLGHKQNSTQVRGLEKLYHHFLIARQLNDDAHDWEADLERGQINSVGALILRETKGTPQDKVISRKQLTRYRKIFWLDVVEDVCQLIESHVQEALHALDGLSMIVHKDVLERLIKKQAESVDSTRREREQALSFLKVYTPRS